MMKMFLFAILLIISNQSFAQYGGILAGIEFSKPLFSDYSNAKSGYMFGFFYNDIINKKKLNYQIEFTINTYNSYLVKKYPFQQNGLTQDELIQEQANSYYTIELTTLFEFPELFFKDSPNLAFGFSMGYSIDQDYRSKIIYNPPQMDPMITDFEKSPLPLSFSLNGGINYYLKPIVIGLRYKLTEVILDDHNFSQDIFITIGLPLGKHR